MADFDKETLDRLVDLAAAHALPKATVFLANGKQGVLIPEGYGLDQIDPVDPPVKSFINASVRHDTDDSFIRYVNEFKESQTRLFVSRQPAAVIAFFDYHDTDTAADAVGRLAHKATYPMPWSPQWLRWKGLMDRGGVDQRTFMEFIEENGEDITNPATPVLVDLISKVQSRKNVEFTSGLRLSDGSIEIAYKEEAETTGGRVGTTTMPSEIEIGIPVFLEGPAYGIKVFVRYHIDNGKLKFQIVMHRWEFTVEDAMKVAVAKIAKATSIEPHWGAVER